MKHLYFGIIVLGFILTIEARPRRAVLIKGQHLRRDSANNIEDDEINYRKLTRNAENDQNSVNLAQKAAQEAKAAQAAQNLAGAQASRMVKKQLAEKALQAARAAEAALSGKRSVVLHVKENLAEAERIAEQDLLSVRQQQEAMNKAIQSAQKASAQHNMLVEALQLAAQQEKVAHETAENAKMLYQAKCRNLSEAKSRLAEVQRKLKNCEDECNATREAAKCALEAARTAYGNTSRRKRVSKRGVKKKRCTHRRRHRRRKG